MKTSRKAFTLVEMLAVIGVIALITLAVVPQVFSTLVATKLTSAGDSLVGLVSLSRQMAVSKNRNIEMRFYSYGENNGPASDNLVKAIVVVELPEGLAAAPGGGAPAVQIPTPLMETFYLPSGIAVARSPILSPILGRGTGQSRDIERFIRKASDATYTAIRFYPDGSTDISQPPNQSYFTVGEERLIVPSSGAALPNNFYAVQIDPLTGRARVFRPGV
jgi:uncharacterized protein (TIGR02596 family)